ncbi:hypothetical protein GOBAR_AA14033 [Gossypium barbadense]|uniref:Armadillo repeat-containing domain-containing protein n=1 Tax=Gossypium barbadense TaxID=3634 RepID=A0A2P5XTD2_GOSBA|nr:hypothetical protein GOBAR_AA14033 [Gossypium barbadense]
MHTSEQPQTPTAEPSGPQPPQTLLDLITTPPLLLKQSPPIPKTPGQFQHTGGGSALIEACRSGSQPIQTHAVGALRNVASVEDIRLALGEEGAVPVLVQLLVSGNTATQEKVANCLSILASSGEYCRALIIQEKGLPRLMHMIQDLSNSDTIEHVLRTICSLSVTDSNLQILSPLSNWVNLSSTGT